MSLQGRKIILAVTGSIAAYKTPQLVRLMVQEGAEVQVIMTDAAAEFVSPLTLATLSRREVFSNVRNGNHWNNHVHLGRWADLLLVAPCTANTLAKMAQGICDNMVQAVYLSCACPVLIAPAMDEDMWHHATTKANVRTLTSMGYQFISTEYGELASGLIGDGRMARLETILSHIQSRLLTPAVSGQTKHALVSAGPTFEPIDPVRFIGNFSSGKMGVAIAESLAAKGFSVDLVLGPGTAMTQNANITIHRVMTAQEMFQACKTFFPQAAVAVMAAAVADFRPETKAVQKIKKGSQTTSHLNLIANPDILAYLGQHKKDNQTLVGFALETQDEVANARQKLQTKNADFIVLNSLSDPGAGFGHDTNKVTILPAQGKPTELPLQPKRDIAESIVNCILRK